MMTVIGTPPILRKPLIHIKLDNFANKIKQLAFS